MTQSPQSSGNQWDRVEKTIGTTAINKLERSKVTLIGLGSLGSWTALELAMSGVGSFTLIDPDTLESSNTVRHAAGLQYVGHPKVKAVETLIKDRNPQASVVVHQEDARLHPEFLYDADLVIVAGLGSEITTGQLAGLIRKGGRPALFGGLYEKAIAGEVFFVDPYNGPCYGCFATLLRDQAPETPNQQVNYGLPIDEVKAQPGLGVHVMRVASCLTDWAIRILIDDPSVMPAFSENLVILSNEKYQIGTDGEGRPVTLSPHSSWWMAVPKNEDCLICGLKDTPQGTIDELLA